MPKHVLKLITVLLLLVAAVWLAGCAGMARGVERSVYSAPMHAPAPAPEAPASAALVVIRYPAMIHADAESLFVSSFAVNAIGGDVPYTMYGKPQTERIAQTVIAKSGYYAMSVYRALKARLPEHTVLLSPHLVLWDQERKLHSRPILASEQVPSVLTLDFSAYTFPDVNEMMDSPPVTFGDLVTPLVVVRSGRWSRPSLNGLHLVSEPLAKSAWRLSAEQTERQLNSRLEAAAAAPPASLDFIAYLAERDPAAASVPMHEPGNGSGRLAVEAYPLEKLQMPEDRMAALADDGDIDPFADEFAEGFSDRIATLLDQTDPERATFFTRQAAYARFDPELARVFFMQGGDESVRARLQLADALIAAEREFLAAQSDSIYAGTYSGDFGIKMRKIIAAEYRMLEERRSLARRQNVTAVVAAMALAGSVYGATVSTTASSAMVASLSGVSLMGSVWALNKSLDARAESAEVNEYFITRMAPTFERQMSVQMEWLESREVITARGFAEFRNKTLTLYQARVRSMAVSAGDRCEFSHPDIAPAGRWYGACRDGRATGRGYGVAGDGDRWVEYVGDADDGLAQGAGAMILRPHGTGGLRYFEGGFDHGRPDGVVRVETAGESPRLRHFRQGRDSGRGDAAAYNAFSFQAGPPPEGLNP